MNRIRIRSWAEFDKLDKRTKHLAFRFVGGQDISTVQTNYLLKIAGNSQEEFTEAVRFLEWDKTKFFIKTGLMSLSMVALFCALMVLIFGK